MARQATKTKTTASKKPARKSPVTRSKTASIAEIAMIPLNKLALSPKNVRKVKPGKEDDAELKASIKENGIKQNLVAYEGEKGTYLVDAGGRRLKALQELADEGAFAKDIPVPCLIEDEAEATITSTTENLQRTAMHPADQFEAFDQMIDEGRTEENIALKFGVSVDLVRRRLKLARVAPEIIGQFRTGEITLECVMAFTLTDNHDRQMTVWNAVKDSYHLQPYSIKRHLTETAYSASSRIGRFVGIETYEAAGGVLLRDLFDDHATAHMENPELLERLAVEKLQEAVKDYEKDWKWVELYLELESDAFRSFGRISPQEIELDADLVKEASILNAREEELAMLNDNGDWSDEEVQEYHAIELRLEEIEELQEARRPYAQEDKAIAGCVVTIGHNGILQVEKGLVRPEDIPKVADSEEASLEEDLSRPQVIAPTSSTPVPISDPATALRKADGVSQSLADDLRATRHQILQAHLAADYDIAYDAMLYTMCQKAMAGGYINETLDLSLRSFHVQNRQQLLSETIAQRMLDALERDLATDWMDIDAPEDFRAMSALPLEDKQGLFAWATAYALKPQLATDNRPNPVIEELGTRLDVDVAACWRPAASTYWNRVNKAHAVSVAREMIGDEFADERNRERKGDLATFMERAFAENALATEGLDAHTAAKTTRWLPKGMAFEEANNVDLVVIDDDDNHTDIEAEQKSGNHDDDQPDELPAFMKENAA